DLGVRPGREPVPARLQAALQRLEVVDLAVEDDGDRPVLVVDRLSAGGEVDDAEASVSERGDPSWRDIFAGSIGAAVSHRIPHHADGVDIDGSARVERHLADDPAHVSGASRSAPGAGAWRRRESEGHGTGPGRHWPWTSHRSGPR